MALFAADVNTFFTSNAKGNTDTRSTNSVSVENIPDHINGREILVLFSTLIGEIRGYYEVKDGACPRLDITFVDRDAASKALCMNGYTVAGTPLSVTALTNFPTRTRGNRTTTDDRRNLYVLGLPFALSKNEFGAIFSKYGAVSHCVILATVDNSSRRRGFVVMSSHEEAKRAMAALTRTTIKGHAIDVSWAVVQRSQGFLDGGDRAMLLDSRSNVPSPGPVLSERQRMTTSSSSDSSLDSHDADPAWIVTSYVPTTSLLVTNLPTLLFSQAHDLHPLFLPFGHIEKLEIVQVSPLGTMSVLVQYSRISVAQEAKDTVSGQLYGSYQIEARFVRPAVSTPELDRVPSTNNLISVTNTRHPSAGSFSSTCPVRDDVSDQRGMLSGPRPYMRQSASLNQLDIPSFRSSNDLAMNHFRQTSTSAKRSPFSNVFDDPRDYTQLSANMGWGFNFEPTPDHQIQHPLSKRMHYNAVYQSSTA